MPIIRQPKFEVFECVRTVEGKEVPDGRRFRFYCPGCESWHEVAIENDPKYQPSWTWDGNLEAPTLNPSLQVFVRIPDENGKEKEQRTLCHLNITKGKIIFHNDSPHKLKGQTVDMVALPEKWRHL